MISPASQSSTNTERGARMHALAAELFPICRSITGEGLRATLRRLSREIPLELHEVRSGTPVLDWTIPDEWNAREAWIARTNGERVVDFAASNLHLVNYSQPIRGRISGSELQAHLHSLPDRPDWIPYRTTYYRRDWGFCLAHHQRQTLTDEAYDVCVDTSLAPGALTYGELFIPGTKTDEVLISAHCCHPSLANDNLSGVVVAVALAQELLRAAKRRLSYRFLFAPGTIGAIAWLAQNEKQTSRVKHGLVLTCVGDRSGFTYKKTRRGDAEIDEIMQSVLAEWSSAQRVEEFSPYGYDERQFCSPGFNLPVGCLMRSKFGTFPEYHTSADNLSFISAAALEETLDVLLAVFARLERGANSARCMDGRNAVAAQKADDTFVNLKPKGEPQLGRYGFYEAVGSDTMPALWVLNFADGKHTLRDISARSRLPFDSVAKAADVLVTLGLLKRAGRSA